MSDISLPDAELRMITDPRSGECFVSVADLVVLLHQGELASVSEEAKVTLGSVRDWLVGLRPA